MTEQANDTESQDPAKAGAEKIGEGNTEVRMVQCVKLGRQAPGLDRPPYPNDLGKRVFENVSREAWDLWIEHSKMIVNEFRIDCFSKEGTAELLKQCENFFFGEGAQLPPDYKPE